MAERLKAPEVKALLQAAFPGADVQMGPRVGGFLFTLTIWNFHLDLSLTSWKVAHVDVVGEMDLTFHYAEKTKNRNVTFLVSKATATDEAELKAFLEWMQDYLKGIVAAISVSFSAPIEPPPLDLFGDKQKP